MAQKKTRRVFTPEIYTISLGGQEYDVAPQPISRIIEFQAVVEELTDQLTGLERQYYITNGNGQDVSGPFETRAEAEGLLGEGQEIRGEGAGVGDFLKIIVESPYHALKVVIPEVKEDDVKQANFPELKNALNVIVEVNGIEWLENFVKKTILPILPEIVDIITSSIKEALISSTSTAPVTNGETPSMRSP